MMMFRIANAVIYVYVYIYIYIYINNNKDNTNNHINSASMSGTMRPRAGRPASDDIIQI